MSDLSTATTDSLRVCARIAGVALLCLTGLLYEREETLIQDRFAALWIKINDAGPTVAGRINAFLKAIAAICSELTYRQFGRRLLSLYAVSAAIGINVGGALIGFAIGHSLPAVIPYGVGMLAVPVAISFLRSVESRTIACVAMLVVVLWYWGYLIAYNIRWSFTVTGFVAIMIFGVCVDLCFIWSSRRLLKRVREGEVHPLFIVTSAAAFIAIAVALPWKLSGVRPAPVGMDMPEDGYVWRSFMAWTALANMGAASIAAVFFITAGLILLHRALWPLLDRLLYNAERLDLAKKKKTLAVAGVALIGLSGPWSTSTITWIRSLF